MSPHARFKVLAGPSYEDLTELPINADSTGSTSFFEIKTASFEGRIVGNIDGFVDQHGVSSTSKYFDREDRKDVTWSIQVQGRFLKPVTADDVLFGNTFEGPPKLPWGASAALQFVNLVDPVLSHDLTAQDPWALSPLIATMPHFNTTRHPASSPLPAFEPLADFKEDVSTLFEGQASPPHLDTASKRRKWFIDEAHRKAIIFNPETILHVDFAYGYFQFPDLQLKLPGKIKFDLKKHWLNYPARFVCCGRGEGGSGPGEVFFVVQFDVPVLGGDVDEDLENQEQEGHVAS